MLVEPTAEDMARGIVEALSDPNAAAKAKAARTLYETKYSRPIYEGKMRSLLAALAS